MIIVTHVCNNQFRWTTSFPFPMWICTGESFCLTHSLPVQFWMACVCAIRSVLSEVSRWKWNRIWHLVSRVRTNINFIPLSCCLEQFWNVPSHIFVCYSFSTRTLQLNSHTEPHMFYETLRKVKPTKISVLLSTHTRPWNQKERGRGKNSNARKKGNLSLSHTHTLSIPLLRLSLQKR